MTMLESERYDRAAYRACRQVLAAYSTSFGKACLLLGPDLHRHIGAIYAVVRVADEIVDGTAAQAGLSAAEVNAGLDEYEARVLEAMWRGYCTDLLVHGFAVTARQCGIGQDLVLAFFESMRADLSPVRFTSEDELDRYVYGSAEVVGLMCLRVFLLKRPLPPAEQARAEAGAKALGSAFQRINFLRDWGHDTAVLGRSYLPSLDPQAPDAAGRDRVLARIDADLRLARGSLPLLPPRPRAAVSAALGMFDELARRLRELPIDALSTHRVSVPTATKTRIFLAAATGRDT